MHGLLVDVPNIMGRTQLHMCLLSVLILPLLAMCLSIDWMIQSTITTEWCCFEAHVAFACCMH